MRFHHASSNPFFRLPVFWSVRPTSKHRALLDSYLKGIQDAVEHQ